MAKRKQDYDKFIMQFAVHIRHRVNDRVDRAEKELVEALEELKRVRETLNNGECIVGTTMRGIPNIAKSLNHAALELTSAIRDHNTVTDLVNTAVDHSYECCARCEDQLRVGDWSLCIDCLIAAREGGTEPLSESDTAIDEKILRQGRRIEQAVQGERKTSHKAASQLRAGEYVVVPAGRKVRMIDTNEEMTLENDRIDFLSAVGPSASGRYELRLVGRAMIVHAHPDEEFELALCVEDHDPKRDRVDFNTNMRSSSTVHTDLGVPEDAPEMICASCGAEDEPYTGAHNLEVDRCPECYCDYQRETLEPGMKVRVNSLPWSENPSWEPRLTGLTGTVTEGPYRTKSGVWFDVELDAEVDEIARRRPDNALQRIDVRESTLPFEPRQLDRIDGHADQ